MKKWQLRGLLVISIVIGALSIGLPFIFLDLGDEDSLRESCLSIAEICIYHDDHFTEFHNFSGSGTETDPYLIQNLQIQTEKDVGIRIAGTSSFFHIKNCSISSSRLALNIVNIKPNTAIIENCTLRINNNQNSYSEGFGIVTNSQGITIRNNTFHRLKNVNDYNLKSYTVGILAEDSSSLQITYNNCSNWHNGIKLIRTDNSVISNNNCSNNLWHGIEAIESANLLISTNICDKNYVGINCWESDTLAILNNHLFNNDFGLVDLLSFSGYITSNNCSFNVEAGLVLRSDSYQVTENFCINNTNGIYIESENSNISRNHLSFNSAYGMFIDYSLNLSIFHNNFIMNNMTGLIYSHAQAYEKPDQTTDIFWFDSNSNEGNFWSDLIWDEFAIYVIDGSNNTDPYPLENPVVILYSTSRCFPLQRVLPEPDC